MPTSDLISSWLNNRFFPSTSAATGGHITASIYVTPWEQFTRERETRDLKGNDSSHLSWQDCLNNTIPPDLQEIFGELQEPWKSIAVCFNTRAAPTYFTNFYRRSTPCTHLWPPPPPRKLPLAASPAPQEAKSQGTNAKGKKSLCTQAISSSKLHKAGIGREDVIPVLAGYWWWEREWGELLPGHPRPRAGMGHGDG